MKSLPHPRKDEGPALPCKPKDNKSGKLSHGAGNGHRSVPEAGEISSVTPLGGGGKSFNLPPSGG